MATLRLRPNGTGASAQHSRNGGSANWSRVSEASTDEDTTYNFKLSAGTTVAVDMFALGNSGGQIGTINGLVVTVRGRAPTNTLQAQVAPAIRPASSTIVGSNQNLAGTYGNFTASWGATNPATSAAWTWTNIDALQAGYQSTVDDDGITASESRITQLYVDVDFNEAFDPVSVSGLALGDTGDPDFVPSGTTTQAVGLAGSFRVTNAMSLSSTVVDRLALTSAAAGPGETERF